MDNMEKNYKIAIIDDTTACIDVLLDSLTKYDAVSVVGTAQTHMSAMQLVLDERRSVVFGYGNA